MYYYTYLLINKSDYRLYVGSRGSKVPPKEDPYMSSSKTVSKEFLQNCSKFILKTFLTREAALLHEIHLHNLYDVAANPRFFNASKQLSTKFDRTGVKLSESQKQNISKANKIACNRPEVKEKFRQSRLGVVMKDSTKQKLRELNLGSKSAKAKKVICIETNTIYGSFSEAALAVGIHYSGIVKVCNNTQKYAAGYTWKYA